MLILGEDGVVRKFSCEKCIKGHRTSGCKHANSPLIEIKKKGRPSTQCEQCKELRKTKHMHVKCICPGNKPESRSRIRPTPYSREPSPNHSRESSPLHMDLDIGNGQQIVGGSISTDLSDAMYTSSVSSEGTMTPTESSSSCSPIFSGNISNETPQAQVAQDGEPMDVLPDEKMDIRTTTEKLSISTPIDPFKLRYHLQRTLNTTMLHSSSSNSIHSVNSPLYSPVTSPRTPPIPINDPTDDLDSDTPLYKTEDGEQVDQAAVLGDLHHTSSEDLMDEIYSGFTEQKTVSTSTCGANCQCGDSCECAGCTLHGSLTDSLPEGQGRPNHIRNIGESGTKFDPIIDEDGVQLCGCGCMKSLESCRDCFQDLCEEYLLNHPHP